MGTEKRSEYQKSYKKYHYKKTRKIITFPLLLEEFETLKTKADKIGTSSNKLAKEIILNHLESQPQNFQSKEQLDLIKEYMRISRGIATNINQIAHSSNIGEVVDINILIGSLKNYEDEFKALVSKVL
jgi:thiamine monophosphate kinase